MRFSIIVPVYKVEKYLRKCIDSILEQKLSVRDIEKIIFSYKNNAEKNNYEIEKNDLEITFKFFSQKEADEFYKKYKK